MDVVIAVSQPTKQQHGVLFRYFLVHSDTEGTDSLMKDSDNDAKIFTMTVLISSFLIYNSVGNID